MDSNKRRVKHSRRGQRGMSLAEVIVTTAIFAVIFIVALTLYDQGNKVFKTSVESADMQQNTRAGFDRLVSDVRMAGYDADRDGVPARAPSGLWQTLTVYAPGAIVSPTVSNGYSYRAVSGGESGNLEPIWPTTPGESFTGDGSVTWVTLGPVYQQPDEQIEFAGRSAITIRANFDYQLDISREHGREGAAGSDVNNPNYEPPGGQFPIVTTANNEIVTYALRSDNGPNPDTIEFWADTSVPRSGYPGGTAERRVQIPDVDLCASGCNNPPYTLMRFTLDANGNPEAGTPVANNIRDLRFNYYTDASGTTLLTDDDGVTAIPNGAIGGDGRFDPANIGGTTNWGDRTQRASIQNIRVELVGMNSKSDAKYVNPTETLPAFQHYRTYTLQSNIVPRNLGLGGLAEPETRIPSPPYITSVCTGACRVTRVQWNPSVTGNVDSYEVHYDTVATGSYANVGIVVPGDVVSAPVFNLTPGTLYYFKIVAVNEIGKSDIVLSNYLSGTPRNKTRPGPATSLTATEGAAAMANQILLTWTAPLRNDPSLNTLECQGNAVSGELIDAAEPIRYRIWRGTSEDFNPAATPPEGEIVLDSGVAAQPNGPGGSIITWTDDLSNQISKPPANCKDYWYRIQVYDTCSLPADYPTWNVPANADTGQSTIFPRAEAGGTDPAIHGYASSTTRPSAPAAPTIDYTNGNSQCDSGTNLCDVKIRWAAVTTDTSNPTQRITVDQYRVRRERKKATDTTWVSDTVLPVLVDASSLAANMEGSNVVYHDTTALDKDPNDRRKWYYRYTITALQCGAESDPSPPVQFPESCGLAGSTVIESGASSGDGSPVSPWVMAENDSIQVIPPSGIDLNRVQFQIYPEPDPNPSNPALEDYEANAEPFVYTWSNRSDGQVYRVVITMTNAQGCTEQTERFIQDDPINCPSSTVTQVGSTGGSGQGTQGLPWVMDAGDTITVNQPANATITSVVFTLLKTPGNATVDGPITDVTAPFVYTWANQTDNETYQLNIVINYEDAACTEDIDRFITDEPPPVCSGATTVVTGAASGDGLTSGTAWLLNGGDSIEVVPPTGGLVNQVVFTITPVSPAGSALPAVTDSFAPYTLEWSDQTDSTIYRVDAVITYSPAACTPETVTRFVRDEVCTGAIVSQTGASGAGTGLTTASPWVFNAGDTVTVQAPVGATITNVAFNLFDEPGTTQLAGTTDGTSPYQFTWTNRTDDALYRLEIVITYAGCTETLTRYIRDEGTCFLTATATSMITVNSGSRKIATITYQITNPSTEVVTLSGIKVSWLRDAQHPEAVLQEIVYNGSVTDTVTSQAPPTTGVISPITPTPPTIPGNSSSYTIAVKYDIGPKNSVSDLATNWVTGLCLQYTVPSFGGSPASCNVIGSISGNPSTCS